MNLVEIRDGNADDEAFIFDSWLRSYRENPLISEIPRDIYFKFQHQIIDDILHRPTTTILVLTTSEATDLIYGYLVSESIVGHDILHYIYVKRPFSGFGLTKKLIDAAPFLVDKNCFTSHWTYSGKKVIERYELKYCPYLV